MVGQTGRSHSEEMRVKILQVSVTYLLRQLGSQSRSLLLLFVIVIVVFVVLAPS
jgi:hypothetical protein